MNELTRTELIEMICPTNATYDCCQGNCSSSCDECEDLLNYLLDRYDAKVKADAIEKFKQKLISYMTNYKPMYLNLLCVIEEIANELKEQNNEH